MRLLRRSTIALLLTFALPLGAQKSESAQTRPIPRIGSAIQDSIIALARRQIGRHYIFGGTSPDAGFDCSGLISYLLKSVNVNVPRNAARQAISGMAVPRDIRRLQIGDLLTFGYGSEVTHIGIYTGGGKFIHASTAGRGVVESLLERPAGRGIKPWIGVRRILLASSGR